MRLFRRSVLSRSGFTLVELLTVVAIILILAALVLTGAGFAQNKAARGRAQAEITSIETALEQYRNDNGEFPGYNPGNGSINSTLTGRILYQAVTGDGSDKLVVNGTASNGTYGSTGKIYWEPRETMLGSASPANRALLDPFGNAYNYRCPGVNNSAGTNATTNATCDIWSTGGNKTGTNQARWIRNW